MRDQPGSRRGLSGSRDRTAAGRYAECGPRSMHAAAKAYLEPARRGALSAAQCRRSWPFVWPSRAQITLSSDRFAGGWRRRSQSHLLLRSVTQAKSLSSGSAKRSTCRDCSAPRETRTPTPHKQDKALNLARLPIPPQARSDVRIIGRPPGTPSLRSVRRGTILTNTCSQ